MGCKNKLNTKVHVKENHKDYLEFYDRKNFVIRDLLNIGIYIP